MKKYWLIAVLAAFCVMLGGMVGCNDASKEDAGNKNPNVADGDNYAPDIFDDWE